MNTPKTSGNGSALWIGIIVVVLVAGVAAVLLARGGDDEPVANQTGSVEVGDAPEGSTTEPGGSDAPAESPSALPPYDATGRDLAVGQVIPAVTGQDFDGNDISITADGTAKVLLFVAHWCPHCQREVPVLEAHLDDNPMPDDVELITISTSVEVGAENYPPQEWLAEEGWSAPVLADDDGGTVASAYGLRAFPYFVAVDAEGRVVARATGELGPDQFDALVAAAQSGAA